MPSGGTASTGWRNGATTSGAGVSRVIDRFGLWIGFHSIDQDTFFEIIEGYVSHFGINADGADVRREALAWSMERGSRSGRVAWQFIIDLAARTETDITKAK